MDGGALSEWIVFEPCGRTWDEEIGEDPRYIPAPHIRPMWIRRDAIIGFLSYVPREAFPCSYVVISSDLWPLVVGKPEELVCRLSPNESQCRQR